MKPKADRLWFGDNGRLYCTEHLGCSAAMTGRDLSGQTIEMVTPDDWRALDCRGHDASRLLTCEEPRCTRHATPIDAGDGGCSVSESQEDGFSLVFAKP